MTARQRKWVSRGYSVSWAAFFMFCILSIVESEVSIRLSKLGIRFSEFDLERVSESPLVSAAPDNLASAPESFRRSLRVEAPEVSVEEMTKTKAWRDLQESVSGYAGRLRLLKRQHQQIEDQFMGLQAYVAKLSMWTTWLYAVAAAGMIIFTFLNRNGRRRENDAEACSSPAAAEGDHEETM